MKYIKTYESFNVNENWLNDIGDWISDAANYIKTKMGDLVDYLGDKYNQFMDKIKEIGNIISEAVSNNIEKVKRSLEMTFGPHFDGMSYDQFKEVILDKYGSQLKTAVESQKANEGYYWEPSASAKKEIHMEQETGTGNTVGSLPKDSGIVQTFLAILQNILGFNLYACGVPGAYLLTLLFGAMGFTGVIAMLVSLLGGILAIFAVTAARKLVYYLEHCK